MIPLTLFLLTSIYELATVPLYWRIIYVLLVKKQFSGPFFQFLAIIGICENLHYVVDVLFYRLPMFGPTSGWFDTSPSHLLSLAPFSIYFFNFPVYFLQIAVSLFRLSAVSWPVRHKKFWKKSWKKIVLTSFCLSLIFCAHRLPPNATTQMVLFNAQKPETGYYPMVIRYELYSIDINLLTAIYNSVVLLLSLLINTGTFMKIVKMRTVVAAGNAGNVENATSMKLEMKMFLIVAWMMLTLIVLIAYQAASFVAHNGVLMPDQGEREDVLYTIFLQQPWVDDLGSMSHPWVLLAMSESIRNAALPFLKRFLEKNC